MFRLATCWEYIEKKHRYYPEYWIRSDDTAWGLKENGALFCVDHLLKQQAKRLLEIGPGLNTYFEQHFGVTHEYWMIDDMINVPYFSKEQVAASLAGRKHARVITGLMGNYTVELPANYFDLTFSISALEHVPVEQISDVCRDLYRVMRPGGYSVHTIDVNPESATRIAPAYLTGFENAGFEYVEKPQKLCWDVGSQGNQLLFETLSHVYQYFGVRVPNLWQTDKIRPFQYYLWSSIQVAVRKPAL